MPPSVFLFFDFSLPLSRSARDLPVVCFGLSKITILRSLSFADLPLSRPARGFPVVCFGLRQPSVPRGAHSTGMYMDWG
jgi:hypothetical protein